MEKDNKYYNIIADIVKKHRKFAGLEAILDDIIDDVYNHSEVIINSVPNESVISAYLEKVVSTSIITVPKKMGFHPEIKHVTVSTLPQQPQQAPQPVIANEIIKKVDNTLVDRMINSAESASTDSEPDLLEIAADKSESNDIIDEPIQEEQKTLLDSFDDDVLAEELDVSVKDEDENTDLFALSEQIVDNDLTQELQDDLPVDKLEDAAVENHEDNIIDELPTEGLEINEVVENSVSDNDFLQEQTEDSDLVLDKTDADNVLNLETQKDDNVLEEISDKNDLLENFIETDENEDEEPLQEAVEETEESVENDNEEVFLEDDNNIEELSLTETDVPVLDSTDESNEDLNLDDSSAEIELDAAPVEDVEQNDLELQISDDVEPVVDIDNSVEELLPEAGEANSEIFQTENSETLELEPSGDDYLQVESDDSLDLEPVNDSFEDSLTIDSSDELLESPETDEFELNLNEETEATIELEVENNEPEKFATTDFSKFDFNPEAVETDDALDTDLIVKDIQDLANKRPELKVIDVYNMKYKDNKSVSEISIELGIDEDSVIDALNEIIAVI